MDSEKVDSIQEKLAGALAVGRYEGSSEFTIDSSSALSKLAGFQFPRPEYWVGKFVQLANAKKAASIHFDVSMGRVEIAIEGVRFPPADQIVKSVLSAASTRDHLLSGLIALAGVKHYAIQLQVTDGEALSESLMGAEVKSEPKRPLERGLSIVVQDEGRGKWVRRRAEQSFLRERCWISGVPLFLNGKPLELRYARGASEGFLRQLGLSGQLSVVSAPIPPLAERPAFTGRLPDLGGRKELAGHSLGLNWSVPNEDLVTLFSHFLLGSTSRTIGGFVNLTLGSKQFSLVPVCDGVQLEAVEYAQQSPALSHVMSQGSGVGFEAYLPVDHEETDLGHFTVRGQEAWSRRAGVTIGPYVHRFWAEFLNSPREFRTIATTRGKQRLVEGSLAFVVGGGAAGLGSLLSGGALGAVALGVPFVYLGGNAANYYTRMFSLISKKVGGLMKMSGFAQSVEYFLSELGDAEPYPICRSDGDSFLAGWEEWPDVAVLERGEWIRLFFQFAQDCGGEFRLSHEGASVRLQWSDPRPGAEIDQWLKKNALLQDALGNLRELSLLSVVLERDSAGSRERRTWSPSSSEKEMEKTDLPDGWSVTVEVESDSPRRWFKRGQRLFEEARCCLREYCWLSESPPLVEPELRVSCFSSPPSGKRSRVVWPYHQIPLVLARRDLSSRSATEESFFCPPPVGGHPQRETEWGWHLEPGFELPETFLYCKDGEGLPGGVVILTAHHRSNSAVEFLHRGVTVAVQPLFHPQDYFSAKKMHSNFWSMGKGEKNQLALRCLLSTSEWTPSGHVPNRRKKALDFLQLHREEILELAELVLENFEALQFKLKGSQVLTRTGYVQSRTVLTREGARRKWFRKQLEAFPKDFDAMVELLQRFVSIGGSSDIERSVRDQETRPQGAVSESPPG